MMHKFVKRYEDYLYAVFRIMIGLMYFQHGFQKLFGLGGSGSMELWSLMGFVGLMEFAGGLAIALGIFTRLAAAGNVVIMTAAYFMAHASKGLLPIVNQGELALLYLAIFLALTAYGAKKWSVEKLLTKKEFF